MVEMKAESTRTARYVYGIRALGGGTVAGAGTYLYGATVTVGATPNPGFVFTKWSQTAGGAAGPQAATPPPGTQRPTFQPAEQPANPVRPSRPAIQPVGGQPVQSLVSGQQAQPAPPTMAPARPELQPAAPKVSAEAAPLNPGGRTAFGGTPYGAAGSAVESWRNWRDNTLAERTAQEEERRRARRKAQGLNIGGF